MLAERDLILLHEAAAALCRGDGTCSDPPASHSPRRSVNGGGVVISSSVPREILVAEIVCADLMDGRGNVRQPLHVGHCAGLAREECYEHDRDAVTDVVSSDVGRHDLGHGEPVPASEAQGVGLATGRLRFGRQIGAPGVPP